MKNSIIFIILALLLLGCSSSSKVNAPVRVKYITYCPDSYILPITYNNYFYTRVYNYPSYRFFCRQNHPWNYVYYSSQVHYSPTSSVSGRRNPNRSSSAVTPSPVLLNTPRTTTLERTSTRVTKPRTVERVNTTGSNKNTREVNTSSRTVRSSGRRQ